MFLFPMIIFLFLVPATRKGLLHTHSEEVAKLLRVCAMYYFFLSLQPCRDSTLKLMPELRTISKRSLSWKRSKGQSRDNFVIPEICMLPLLKLYPLSIGMN